ncbi:MAG: RICIN domain-containing protein [Clostridia bacterium]|nr:RICIN domain-containing protein [Clostridia bacterium]
MFKFKKTFAIFFAFSILYLSSNATNSVTQNVTDFKKLGLKSGTYEIISKLNKNKSLDIKGANKQSGVNLQLYKKNNTNAQRFNIVYDGNGYYTIQAKCSGKMLDVPCQSKKSETKIWQYDKNNTDAQKWKLIKNNDGTYSFVSKCNGLYLDVTSGNTLDGTLLQCYKGNGTNAQKFFINNKNKFTCINKKFDGFDCGNIGSFITEENKSKNVLLVEFNPYHHECVPGYVKYFLNLGYEVDIFILSGYEDCFSRFDKNEKLKIYTFKNYDEIYENSMILSTLIEKYKFIFLNSIETQHRPLNEMEIFQKPNTIAVAHSTNSLKKGDWYFRNIFNNFINEKRIVTLGKFNVGTFVNPHYFGKIDNHIKNKKTNFIVVGNIYSSNRNYNMLIDAVKKLKSKNLDFKITIVGRSGSLNVPQEIKEYFNPKGSVNYRNLYKEVDNSDYMLMLLDPKNKEHLRYKTSNVTGNAQLCYGFSKPPIISDGFSDFYKLNNGNSIIYSDNLAVAMEKAITMDENSYFNLQKNLKETAKDIFNISLDNLKNILHS